MVVMRGGYSRRLVQRLRQALIGLGSVRVKLLLPCFVLFMLVVVAGRAANFMGWRHKPLKQGSLPLGKGYTILINTWKRNDLLKQSVEHYSSCSGLHSIHIVWSEPDPPTDSLRGFLHHVLQLKSINGREVDLHFDINQEDSLNNRFKVIKDLETDAIFSIDDDVVFPCPTVEFAYSVWQSAPDTMVGFVPRMHWLDKTKEDEMYYAYGGWWSVWWMGTYSMVLSKAAFFHRKYLDMYTNQMPASIRDYVTRNRNCEDIAMSFLVANATGAPPIWVQGKIFEIGSTGISSLQGHSERRSQCVNRFVIEYGHMPLVESSVKAVDSRRRWFW
ncbi:hypothetical protein AMTRI_Chr08g202160 [Amborella trichopoda]|uniref:Glycosyl transferase 64 domain-containing protein n=1 Tax=Amborella trichopoda TaxID=13333 RepID=W1PPL8_AMBTC|nr:glycosyltransferase family 64 protein C4 [Amborella trichopoda]ERN09729.1 hypothetical protein AMTR_s00029p00228900 [Amborella trichopoda]|eukprot:XP_006848148.1 glycosyltransferase family 64 protein C4 [Amborella trichopoda]